jgi:hypothetical protein
VPAMSFQLDKGYNISPGEFKLVVDAIETWPVSITFTTTNCNSIKVESDYKKIFEIAFSETFDDETIEILKKCSWTSGWALKTIAAMIPKDTLLFENERDEIDYQIDQFESFIGNIRGSDTWKAKQDLWIKNREYRELKANFDRIKAHIPEVGVFISEDDLEFYLSFDNCHDVCIIHTKRTDA